MWHSRRGLSPKQIFLAKLGACSCCIHLFLLAFLFLMRGEQFTQRINFTLPANIKFVYVPFKKQTQPVNTAGIISQQEIRAVATQPKSKTVMAKRVVGKKPKKTKKAAKKRSVPTVPGVASGEAWVEHEVRVEGNERQQEQAPVEIGALELDALETAQAIREEVVRVWQPPAGLAIGRHCTAKVLLDWQGNIQELSIAESSQVPVFDASVKLALRAMKFPKAVFGRELILPFGA